MGVPVYRPITVLALALAGAPLAASVASAAPYFAYAQDSVDIYGPGGAYLPGGHFQDGTFSNSPSGGTSGTIGASNTQAGQNLSAWGSADLTSGTLKAKASATIGSGYSAYVLGDAAFGDSFTATTSGGGAFNWANGQGTFTMTLDGTTVAPTLTSGQARLWNVLLQIYKPGTLAAGTTGDVANRLAFLNFFETDYAGYGPLLSMPASDPNSQYTTNSTGTLGTGLTLTAAFNFGSDFDWTLELGALGSNYTGPMSIGTDLSQTLTVGYQGPAGTTTTSQSGAFPDTLAPTAVAEPATPALLGIALILLGLIGIRTRVRNA